MAMTSSDNEQLNIADWLSAIHLERYQDSFRQHGYHRVKDILSVDNDILQKIGVGATGHRKRIMSRLRHVSGESNSLPTICNMEKTDSLEYSDRSERDDAVSNKKNSKEKFGDLELAVKPVPKPRTVFNKYNANATAAASIHALQSPVSLDGYSSVARRSSLQETVVPRGNSLDTENCNSCIESKPGGVELEAGIPKNTSAEAGKPLHPIPSLPMRQNKESLQPGSSYQQHKTQMEADTMQRSPLSSLSSFAGNEEEVTSFSTNPSSPQETLTMISNEIYSGFGSRTGCVSCAPDSEAPQIHINPFDMINQETTSTQERNCPGSPEAELPVVPERPISSLVTAEALNPYCETVFNRISQTQEPKDVKNGKIRTCSTMPMFTPGEERSHPWNTGDTSKEKKSEVEDGKTQRITQIVHNEQEGYSTVDSPEENKRFSLPSHLYTDEITDDMTISPYASFTSMHDKSRPVLVGWLDKLSPQGNYVFQRRFVRFDGNNLMYFSNDKELEIRTYILKV